MFGEKNLPHVNSLVYGLQSFKKNANAPAVERESKAIICLAVVMHSYAFELGLRDMMQMATILEAAIIALEGQSIHIFFLVFLASLYQKDSIVFGKVEKAKNLGVATGFTPLDNDFRSSIEFLKFDDRGHGESKRVGILEIANQYLRNMHYKIGEPRHAFSAYEFPGALMTNVEYLQSGDSYQAEFSNYFFIVQHAGGFVS